VRPTDENQGASTRPNLMSSRRGAGEENILAMLERDAARRSGTRMTSPRLAWYCAAAAFSGILAGAVAWLAYDNHETASAMQVQVQAERVAEGGADTVSPPPLGAQAPAPGAEPQAAVIVEQQPEAPPAPPPLVMLPPEAALAATAAPAEPKPAKADRDGMPAKHDAAARPAKADKRGKADKPAAGPRRTAAARIPARTRKAAAPAPADSAVDTDVALISAIIQHADRHRSEREQRPPPSRP